jgi:murein hydrolase activator
MTREPDHDGVEWILIGQAGNLVEADLQRVAVEAGRRQRRMGTRQGAGEIAHRDTNAPFANIESNDPSHARIIVHPQDVNRFLSLLAIVCAASAIAAQAPDPQARRVDDRMRALQRENEQLAREATTLLSELRRLEIQRDLRVQEWMQAEASAMEAQAALARAVERLATLELEKTSQLPDLRAQLVDVYKRGRGGYARMIFGAADLRDFARATRAVAALASINERRISEHRRTMQDLTAQRHVLEQSAAQLRTREGAARAARGAADRAVADVSAHIARIDSRRDLTAQYVGELQVSYERLQQQLAPGAGGRTREAVSIPLLPFRGSLEWPASGRLAGRFGQATERLGGTAVRNGIEIAVPENTPVRAVHGGTVGLAGPFIGFGNLVIVEHGANNFSLYGYLGTVGVERGARVDAGAELGRSGSAPAGPPALYFEMRIDGRSVDPVQWLKPR